jgi:hypothetical protein
MRWFTVAVTLLASTPVLAQVGSRPGDPPIVTAENDAWYRQREPVVFAGDFYYPAGATVFFNRNTMVRTGHYNGVPLYADTTLEPYSIVYVPIGGAMMQPYERVRRGDLASSAGSRTPSFPVRTAPEPGGLPEAAAAPTTIAPAPPVARAASPEPRAVGTVGDIVTPPVGTAGTIAARQNEGQIATVHRAENNDGVWLRFMGGKWVSAGPAVPLRASEFVRVGEYSGYPVFARVGLEEELIYLPSLAGFVAPFRLKE